MGWFMPGRSPLFLFVSVGVSAVVLHCGGADGSSIITGGDDAAADAASTNGTEGGANGNPKGNDASAIDAGTSIDGSKPTQTDGATAIVPDGGAQPTPTGVTCGATALCDTTTSTCCAFADGGAACLNGLGGAVCGAGITAPRQCDETADCPPNLVCCYEVAANGAIGSSCHGDCNGGGNKRAQACRQQADCKNATCAVRACNNGGTIESCGPLDNACQ